MIRTEKCFKLFWIFAISLTIMTMFIHYRQQGLLFGDHEWLWKECACTLQGIDSAIAIQNNIVVPRIGELPDSTSTLPWTKVIGVLVHGAFLPYGTSCIYYSIINIALLLGMLALIFRNIYGRTYDSEMAGMSVLAVFSSWYFVDWMQMGNNAGIVCFLTICAICLVEKHQLLAGICMGIAMIKPQIVFPFFIVWFIMKKWKLIITSMSIVMVSWIASVLITKVSPLEQLANLLNMRVEMEESYLVYGIFDQCRIWGVDTKVILLMSMVVGIGLCIYLTVKYLSVEKTSLWGIYVIPAIVSVFWCYKSQCDYNILIIIPIALVEYWYTSEKTWRQLLISAILVIVCMMKPFSVVGVLLDSIGIIERVQSVYLMHRLDLYAKTICVIIGLAFYIKRKIIR